MPGLQVFGDLVAVEPPVLDKNLVGAIAGHDHAGQINAGHIALQALRIKDRLTVAAFDAHSERGQEIESPDDTRSSQRHIDSESSTSPFGVASVTVSRSMRLTVELK